MLSQKGMFPKFPLSCCFLQTLLLLLKILSNFQFENLAQAGSLGREGASPSTHLPSISCFLALFCFNFNLFKYLPKMTHTSLVFLSKPCLQGHDSIPSAQPAFHLKGSFHPAVEGAQVGLKQLSFSFLSCAFAGIVFLCELSHRICQFRSLVQ